MLEFLKHKFKPNFLEIYVKFICLKIKLTNPIFLPEQQQEKV